MDIHIGCNLLTFSGIIIMFHTISTVLHYTYCYVERVILGSQQNAVLMVIKLI